MPLSFVLQPAVIAVGGEYGTLSEVALALRLGTPVIGIDTWTLVRPDGKVDTGIVVMERPIGSSTSGGQHWLLVDLRALPTRLMEEWSSSVSVRRRWCSRAGDRHVWHMRNCQPMVLEISRPVVIVIAITPPHRDADAGTPAR